MRLVILITLLAPAIAMFGQSADTAQLVYNKTQDSVFLIYLNDASGTPHALGSAFLVSPHTLITNAHVADAGSPVLAVGPVRIPLTVLRTDEKNDLAVLTVDAELTSKLLPLSSESVTPGEQVFAIGNPEGLEKTISQGIVSGLRKHDGRDLLQITTPISHGSSGGPILNGKGEVVGVAVGMLAEGQNLNFAVPVSLVKDILARKSGAVASIDPNTGLSQLKELIEARGKGEYSNDADSEYQKDTQKIKDLAEQVESTATAESILTQIACMGVKDNDLSDSGLKAARKLVQISSSAEHRALLAYTLMDLGDYEGFTAQILDKDTPAQKEALDKNKELLSQASREAADAAKFAKGKGLLLADYVLGQAKRDEGNDSDSIQLESLVATGSLQICDNDLAEQSVRNLVSENTKLKRIAEAEKWFSRLESQYDVYPIEWDAEGDRRANANEFNAAADAYEKAAAKAKWLGYDYCYASNIRHLEQASNGDTVLADGRKCVEASLDPVSKNSQAYFDDALPTVYRNMANILNTRGVYQPALEYIQESLLRKPDEPFSLVEKAEILNGLQKYSECVTVAQAAIRGSDGKYAWMQFDLGNCYFEMEDWPHAEAAYRIAAENDKTNAAAAFNLALSLLREGYGVDARTWFREALNRKPDDELRSKILNQLK